MDIIRDSDFDTFDEETLQSKDGILVTDLAGKILISNEVVKEMWGRDRDRFLKSVLKIVSLKSKAFREEVALADGMIVDCHTFPMIGSDKKVHGRIWYLRDITEQKRVQDLRNLQHLMLENLAEGVVLTKVIDNTIAYANKRFEEIFGYGRNELLGKNITILNDPHSSTTPNEVRVKIGETLVRDGRWSGEMENIRKDGVKIWSEIKIVNIRHSQFGECYLSIQSDVSDRKLAIKQLLEREKKYRVLFENNSLAILLLTTDGTRILDANSAASELFGWSHDELLQINRLDLIDPEDKRFPKLLKKREMTGQYRGRYKIVCKNGAKVECEGTSASFLGPDGFEQTHVILRKWYKKRKI